MTPSPTRPFSLRQQLTAWAVHAFTLSGFLWAVLATLAMIQGQYKAMWGWLTVALIVDGIDGTFARKACVKEVIPWFDGATVDIVVDYLTGTFIPAMFMHLALPMGPGWLGITMTVTVLVSSMFCYANTGWKSEDYYFVGFPAAWNIVAVCLWVLATSAWANVAIVIILAILSLIPTHYVHPIRVKRLRTLNLISVGLWIAATAVMVTAHPARPTWALAVFLISGGWFLFVGMRRTAVGIETD